MIVPIDVGEAVLRHNLNDPEFVHDDLQVSNCSCVLQSKRVTLTPPINTGLPDGGVCFACGSMTVRTGTCTTCTGCGETGGCG